MKITRVGKPPTLLQLQFHHGIDTDVPGVEMPNLAPPVSLVLVHGRQETCNFWVEETMVSSSEGSPAAVVLFAVRAILLLMLRILVVPTRR